MPHWVRDVFLGVLSNKKQKLVININSNEHFARGHVRDVGRSFCCAFALCCALWGSGSSEKLEADFRNMYTHK